MEPRPRPTAAGPEQPIELARQVDEPGTGPFDLVFVLLMLQAAMGLVALMGTMVFAIAIGAPLMLAGGLVLGLLGPVLAIWLAIGISRLRRWARNGTVLFEALIVIGFVVRVLIGRELAFGLMPFASGVVIPLSVIGILVSRSGRRAISARRKPAEISALEPAIGPVELAA